MSRASAAVAELKRLGYGDAAVVGKVLEILSKEDACPASLIDCA